MKKLLISIILTFCSANSFAGDWINIGSDSKQTFYINTSIMDEDNNHIVWLQKTFTSSEARNNIMRKFSLKKTPYTEKCLIAFNNAWTKISIKKNIFYDSKGDVIESINDEFADMAYIVPDSNGEFWRDQSKIIYDTNHNNYTSPNNNNSIYTVVEQMPMFPGGDAALMNYLQDSIQYPKDAKEKGIQGRIVVGFVVEQDGSITNPTIMRSVYPSLDKEAIRIVENMPKWIPAKQNGQSVREKYQVSISFRQ